ncbi:MAG: MFS transporter [Chloroflexota bacterium]|nr:MFS transporter [Chloroflexota bacterium]
MIATFRDRDFTLLWFAGLVSLTGDWILLTALPVYVFEQTASVLATALVLIVSALPGVFLGSVVGVFVDRWDRRRTMVVVSLCQALVIPGFLVAHLNDWLWLVYVVLFTAATLGQFFQPAENALLPTLVPPERLVTANTLNALNDNLARIVGPSIGGVVLAWAGFSGTILLDSASFLVAAGLIARIARPRLTPLAEHAAGEDIAVEATSVRREWAAGLRVIRAHPVIRGVFTVAGLATFADSILSALLVPFVLRVAGGDAALIGVLLTVRGIAGVLGGVVVARRPPPAARPPPRGQSVDHRTWHRPPGQRPHGPRDRRRHHILLGPAIVAWLTAQRALLQAHTADAYRGRVFGAFGTVNTIAFLLGASIAGVVGDRVGIVPLLDAAGVSFVMAGLVAIALLRDTPSLAVDGSSPDA